MTGLEQLLAYDEQGRNPLGMSRPEQRPHVKQQTGVQAQPILPWKGMKVLRRANPEQILPQPAHPRIMSDKTLTVA